MPTFNPINDEIFTVSQFFSPEECEAQIQLAEAIGFEEAPVSTASGPRMLKDLRNNTRVMIDDLERASDLWLRIRDYVPSQIDDWQACGVNERLRFYRYDIGQQFDWHTDGYYRRQNGQRSHLTFMIYLNEGFAGGETSIEEVTITPQQGLALCFIHHLRHKGQPVDRGRKYVLRTDVMYRRLGT